MKRLFICSICLAIAFLAEAQPDYTNGVFILNEDWFGNNNSTINFLNTNSGLFDYYLVQSNADNGKLSMGCTAQFGTIYGGNLYVIAKQDQDPGEQDFTGGRVVIVDAQTLKIKKSIPVIAQKNGNSIADGRGFVGVDETKGYVGTSNGIYILDLQTFEIVGCITGSENPLVTGNENNADGLGALYRNQIGMMIRTHDYVFAIQQDKGILVINSQTDTIEKVIEGCFSTLAQSKDGTIWVGKNSNMNYQTYPYGNFGASGEEWTGNQLLKINPATLETEIINITSGGINQTWYAWTAGSFCSGAKENKLYFTFNSNKWDWFTSSEMFVYDIDNNNFSKIYDTKNDKRYFYGAAIRVNPLDDKLYASLYKSNVDQNYWIYQMKYENDELELQNSYTPIKRYWFPALFIFPDNHAPQVSGFNPVTITDNQPVVIDLSAMATDEDNLAVAITKRIIANDKSEALSAVIKNNTLTLAVKGNQTGTATITVRFNSNGKIVDKILTVHFSASGSGINDITDNQVNVFARNGIIHINGLQTKTKVQVFNLQGQLVRSEWISGTGVIDGLPAGQIYLVKIGNRNYKLRTSCRA
jgi:hypothetical protein